MNAHTVVMMIMLGVMLFLAGFWLTPDNPRVIIVRFEQPISVKVIP